MSSNIIYWINDLTRCIRDKISCGCFYKLTEIGPYWKLSLTHGRLPIKERYLIHRSDISVCPFQLGTNCVLPNFCHCYTFICKTPLFKHTAEKSSCYVAHFIPDLAKIATKRFIHGVHRHRVHGVFR